MKKQLFSARGVVMWGRVTAVVLLLALFGVWQGAGTAVAQVTPINFDDFTGTGFSPTPSSGQLDSNLWRVKELSDGDGTFGGTHTSGDFARGSSNGGVSTGGIYAFDTGGGNIILGVQPSTADFTPGTFTLRLQNNTGSEIANVYIAYDIWYLNNEGRSSTLNFAYSLDDSAYTTIPTLDFTTPEAADASPSWQSVSRSQTIASVNWPAGDYLYLQWQSDDVGGSGSRDEFGIDDIEVRIGGPTAVSLHSFSGSGASGPLLLLLVVGLLAGGTAVVGQRRRQG